jgi:hypothetical protein
LMTSALLFIAMREIWGWSLVAAGAIAGVFMLVDAAFFVANFAHAIYIANVDLVHVENSRFSNTRQAHSIKSGALRTEVIGCTITDGPEGTSSYLIDLPNGGAIIVRDNTLEKGPKSENHATAISPVAKTSSPVPIAASVVESMPTSPGPSCTPWLKVRASHRRASGPD